MRLMPAANHALVSAVAQGTQPCATSGWLPVRLPGALRKLATLGAIALIATGLHAAGPAAVTDSPAPMVVRHYSSTEGLPVSSASNAALDADGFLWLATHDGLARFDGREFSVYDAARFPEMGGNRIVGMYPDGFGRLYALGAGGEWLQVDSQQIRRVRPDPQQPEAGVRHVQTTPALCVTLPHGLYCAGKDGMQLRRRFEPGQNVRLAMADGTRDWLLLPERGVLLCGNASCATMSPDPPIRMRANWQLQAAIHDSTLLLGMPQGLLQLQDDRTARWRVLAGATAFDLIQFRNEPDGSMLVGTSDGLFRLVDGDWAPAWAGSSGGRQFAQSWRGPDGALWHSVNGRLFRAGRLALASSGEITSMLFDDEGTAFVTTLRDGFYVIAAPRVELLGDRPELHAGNLYGMSLAGDGSVWLGSLGGGLQRLWPDGRYRRYDRADGLPGDNIWVVAVAPDQRVFVASYMPGFLQLHEDGRFRSVPTPEPLQSAQIRSFSFDRSGSLWVGGSAGAWQQAGDGWQQRWPVGDSAMVQAVVHEPDGVVWYGGTSGLWRQDARQSWAVAAPLLGGVAVRGLLRASDGAIWACSEGRGLIRVAHDDPHGERAIRLGRAEGLPSNSPHSLIEDARGDLWVNSNQGIFRITRASLDHLLAGRSRVLSPLTLGLADGLTELEGNGGVQPAVIEDPQGRIWFPSQRGVVRFDPLALPLRQTPPKAVIDGMDSAGAAVRMRDATLPAGVRSVQLRYNASDLHSGREVRFRYRLRPGDQGWTDAGVRRVAAYAALLPGAYRFEVLAGNSDGFWAQQPATLEFRVPAFWYETAGFQLSLMGMGLLAVAGLAQWRLGRVRRRAQLLDSQVQLRTRELSDEKQRVETTLAELAQAHGELALTHEQIESRNLRLADQAARLEALDRFRSRLLADVSHELRTPLMLIKLPLHDVIERSSALSEADRQQLLLPLKQTERLGHLVEQLVGLVQAEAGQLNLRVQRVELVAWTGKLLAGFQPAAAQLNIRLHLSAPESVVAYADVVHLATIVGNLLDNALKFAPSGSEIQVRIDRDRAHERARLQVIDGGPGFAPELAQSLFERFFRVQGPPRNGREGLGIGLALARELVELHGGSIGAQVLAGTGTVFWFELPLGSAHVELDELALGDDVAPVLLAGSDQHGGILLVEDHPELAAYLRDRLAERFPVELATDAESAWTRVQQGDIRLLISDVVLPGMDGVSLCRRLKNTPGLAQVPVILISAKAGRGDRQDGLDAGAAAWLSKPFLFSTLLDEIHRHWPNSPDTSPQSPNPASIEIEDPILLNALRQLADPEFGVAQWSANVHLSDRQLRRRVTELTGLSPLIWLREQRLAEVRRRIRDGSCRTLAEAGLHMGFTNPAYLYRLYRARFGSDGVASSSGEHV